MDLLHEFQQHWASKAFAQPNDTVLLAVSGGIDSMVMAQLFLSANIPFAMAHCNFQLRGVEADKDEQLVTGWAKKNNIPFHHTRFKTQQKADEWKKGIQETARILRYEWLEYIREQNKYAAIVTAHHANDNAETLLMNLFRGTGMAGLHGIQEKNDKIIRPLLFAQRNDIEAYATANNVPFREDASNATDDYSRNAIRHNILPAAGELFPGVITNLNESIKRFAQAEVLYTAAIEQERKKLLEKRGRDFYIPVLKLLKRKPLETICYELLTPFGFVSKQVPQVLNLLHSEPGHYISSATHRIIKDRNFLVITANEARVTDMIQVEGVPCTVETEHGHFHFSFEKKSVNIPTGNDIACIDMRLLSFPLTLRKWRQGDYFYPFGMGMKKKKLAKFFIDQKLPIHEKERVWVLESQKRIAWVAGMRLDERFKIKNDTEQIVKISYKAL